MPFLAKSPEGKQVLKERTERGWAGLGLDFHGASQSTQEGLAPLPGLPVWELDVLLREPTGAQEVV